MIYQLIINFVEIIAVISGVKYIMKYREDSSSRYFVYFLYFTLFVELVFGWLPTIIENLETLRFLESSIFFNNQWTYNIYDIISFSFYLFFITLQIKSSKFRGIGRLSIFIFIAFSVGNLLITDVFFKTVSSFNYILGSILIFLFTSYYFFQLLLSDNILAFYKLIPFYVVSGSLLFYLIVTPIFIYGAYYNKISPQFVNIHALILTLANIFMYTCYSIGFIVCSKKNKSY